MKSIPRFLPLALVVLFISMATSVLAVVPSPLYNVTTSIDTGANTMTWHVTNLTDDTSGFSLVRMDWLYPIYDIDNVEPASPWSFAKYQLAPDDWSGGFSTSAVSWMTSVSNGMGYGDSLDFTIHSVPPVVDQEPLPLHLMWQRLAANTPKGEPTTMDVGVVPEPSSLLVLIGGISGLGTMAWRRRKR